MTTSTNDEAMREAISAGCDGHPREGDDVPACLWPSCQCERGQVTRTAILKDRSLRPGFAAGVETAATWIGACAAQIESRPMSNYNREQVSQLRHAAKGIRALVHKPSMDGAKQPVTCTNCYADRQLYEATGCAFAACPMHNQVRRADSPTETEVMPDAVKGCTYPLCRSANSVSKDSQELAADCGCSGVFHDGATLHELIHGSQALVATDPRTNCSLGECTYQQECLTRGRCIVAATQPVALETAGADLTELLAHPVDAADKAREMRAEHTADALRASLGPVIEGMRQRALRGETVSEPVADRLASGGDVRPLRAAPPAPVAARMEWRDIASAPRDGTRVLLTGGSKITIAAWVDTSGERWEQTAHDTQKLTKFTDGFWDWEGDQDFWEIPTHWQPHPPPPAPREGE